MPDNLYKFTQNQTHSFYILHIGQTLPLKNNSFLNSFIIVCNFSHPAEDWKAVNEELQKSSRFVIKNQTTGDRLKIRVVAVNEGGRSPPVSLPEPVLVKEVAGKNFFQ